MSNSQNNPMGPKTAPSLISLPFRIIGSFVIGLCILSALICLLAWGTFVESEYGRTVANFVLYGSQWFAALLALLGLNVACAVIARFPWRRHHLPFLVTHLGIIILLVGCYWTWQGGEEAQITLPEGAVGRFAVKMDKQVFQLNNEFQTTIPGFVEADRSAVSIAFEPGPFNWDDYSRSNWLHQDTKRYRDTVWLAMQLGNRSKGVLVDEGKTLSGVKFEVLNYLAGSTTLPVPPLELSMLWKKTIQTKNELGDVREHARNWERIKLQIKPTEPARGMDNRGTRAEMFDGERVCYYMTNYDAEIQSFLSSKGNDTSSESKAWGTLVLYYNGENYLVDLDQLLSETEGGTQFPVKGTVFKIGDVRFRARGPLLDFTLYAPGDVKEKMTLISDFPDKNIHAVMFGVFGNFQVSPRELAQKFSGQVDETTIARLEKPRLEILQGPDKHLYYRYWTGNKIAQSGAFPLLGEDDDQAKPIGRKPTLNLAQGTADEVEIVLERFVPQDLPGLRIVAQPVGRSRETSRRALVRMTVDGKEDTFWIRAEYPSVVPLPPERDQMRFVHGNGRTVRVQWKHGTIDLGFGVLLKQFEKRTEPGTRMPSHYSSLVDFVEMPKSSEGFARYGDGHRAIRSDVLILMNQPAVFQGGEGGHRYRIYQSAFDGPFHPDDYYRFHHYYDAKVFPWETKPRESLYTSTLSINHDPGRGLKYLGCFMSILGCSWYFFSRKGLQPLTGD